VDADDAAERSRSVVERLLDHRHRNAEPLHARGRGAAQIVQAPCTRSNPGLGADPALDRVPVIYRPLAVDGEHEITASKPRALLDQLPGLRAQRYCMRTRVFGAPGRQPPQSAILVNFLPAYVTDLAATRAGQDQHLDSLLGRAIAIACEPQR